jgi:hypothetical protein
MGGTPVRDGAYWITWYDLAEADRSAYLDWVHDSYIPKVLARHGVLWGAHYAADTKAVPLGGGQGRVTRHAPPDLPGGKEFVLMFGAAEPYVFADPPVAEFHAELGENDRRMLAMRKGERTNLMIDEARVDGPEAGMAELDGAPSPVIQLGSFNAVSPAAEDELATWYARWRLPSMTTRPGIVRVRKLVSIAGWAKHACLYEFTTMAARSEHFIHYEDSRPDMAAWSVAVVNTLVHATPRTVVATRTWPPVG